ncbi:hypothetical protein JCM18237_28140 [Halorubrum luteum]
MTDTNATIERRVERIETIIEQLESGDVSLAEARELRDEAKTLLENVQADLDVGDGTVEELHE